MLIGQLTKGVEADVLKEVVGQKGTLARFIRRHQAINRVQINAKNIADLTMESFSKLISDYGQPMVRYCTLFDGIKSILFTTDLNVSRLLSSIRLCCDGTFNVSFLKRSQTG